MSDFSFNFSSSSFYVLHSITGCWRCGGGSLVYALMVSSGARIDVVQNVQRISREAYFVLKAQYPLYAPDFSQTQQARVFMNHCGNCRAKLGDYFLHCEPGGSFWPLSGEEASDLVLRKFATPIQIAGQRGNGFGKLLLSRARDHNDLQIGRPSAAAVLKRQP
jgi:hypothetical protein